MIRLIDTHQHLWGIEAPYIKPHWVDGLEIYNQNYRYEEYAKSNDEQVQSAIYMEVAVNKDLRQSEIDFIDTLIKDPNTITQAMVVADTPGSEGFRDRILKHKENPNIKGIRQILQEEDMPRGTCNGERFIEDLKLLGDHHLLYDLCIRTEEILDSKVCVESCPQTTFVLDHCGNMHPNDINSYKENVARGEQWKSDMEKLGKLPNLICKLSGILVRASENWSDDDLKPAINHCIDCFGTDKVVFGGDWPIFVERGTLSDWAKSFREIIADRSISDQHKICHENAERIYSL
jgi:L-fuconolactonase